MKKTIPQNIKIILNETKDKLKEIYGDNLKGVILFGSYAKGKYSEGSDIDIAVVINNISNISNELAKISKEMHKIDFKYDMLLSAIPIDFQQYNKSNLPLIRNIKREGIFL